MERWRRNFYAVWPGLLTVSMGLMGVVPALPLYIEERFSITDPVAVRGWTAVVFGAAPLTAAVCGPFWGALGDRVGRKAMVLRAQLGIAVALALMPLCPTPATLAGMRVFQGLFAGFIAPSMALVSVDVPADQQGRVIARLQLALALGLALGPQLGAEVATLLDRRAVFWLGSGLAVMSALPVALVAREDRSALAAHAPANGEPPVSALRWLRGNRAFLALLAMVCLLRFGIHMVEPFTALWVRELGPLEWLGGDRDLALERTVATAFTVLAIGQLLMATTWGRLADRFGPARGLAVVALGLSAVNLLIATVHRIEFYMLLRCTAALLMAGTMTLAYAAAERRVMAARRSLGFGMLQSGIQLGLSLGPLAGSAVAAGTAGMRGLFAVAAGVLLVAGLVLWRAHRSR